MDLYLIYISRRYERKSVTPVRVLHEVLRKYAEVFMGDRYSVISSPGYLSTSRIEDYIIELESILAPREEQRVDVGFLKNMNTDAIRLEHIEEIKRRDRLSNIPLDICGNSDHRKMMVFFNSCHFRWQNNQHLPEEGRRIVLNQSNLSSFLNQTEVYAVLLGSSNQSYNTYFNDRIHRGEADVFMIATEKDESEVRGLVKDEWGASNRVVISKALYGPWKPADFLKSILEELLEYGIR